ncbi:hypothetical protein B0H14DRAFT_3592282 [Mycena olivaceomarginata]|nr:hypothetical protein B0H14DRAFT_3592282 [Mycena olivaceomarginata]
MPLFAQPKSGMLLGLKLSIIPVHVDILIPKDPADPFGGLKSNASSLRRLNATYNVFGVFCQPNTVPPKNADGAQLPLHGFTYTQQYWSPPTEEFRNYSYTGDDTLLRWGTLDSNYITTSNHSMFYPANIASFSPCMLLFDTITKDVDSLTSLLQLVSNSLTVHYTGDVVKVVGSEDQALCADEQCADVTVLNSVESVLWPEAKSLEVVEADMNQNLRLQPFVFRV